MSSIFYLANLTISSLAMATGQPAEVAQQSVQQPVTVEESAVKVTVKKGDFLSKIAKKYDTTWQRIYYANKDIKHPDVINPGDKLVIPDNDEKLKPRPIPGIAKASAKPAKTTYSQPKKQVNYPAVGNSVWDSLAQCESGGNWGINTGNGYYGGLQFTLSTWRGVGGSGYPHQASREEQIYRGKILQARSGWGQWPACSAKLGLR